MNIYGKHSFNLIIIKAYAIKRLKELHKEKRSILFKLNAQIRKLDGVSEFNGRTIVNGCDNYYSCRFREYDYSNTLKRTD